MRTFFLLYVVPCNALCKSDGAMYLPQAKAMHLWRDVRRGHVADLPQLWR